MRTNISRSFSRCREVAGLAILFSAFCGASSNVLAQAGTEVVKVPVGQTVDSTISVSRQASSVTRVVVFKATSSGTPTSQSKWSFEESPGSFARAFFLLSDASTATTARGTMATVVYTFTPPPYRIADGVSDGFVVVVSDEAVLRGTLNVEVTYAADSLPRILDVEATLPNKSTTVGVLLGATRVEITLRAEDDDTVAASLTWSLSAYSGVVGSATFLGGESSATGTEVTVVYSNAGGIVTDAEPRLTATVTDGFGMDSVQVYVKPYTTPTIVVDGLDGRYVDGRYMMHSQEFTAEFTLTADSLAPGDAEEDLRWGLGDVYDEIQNKDEYSTVLLVDAEGEKVSDSTGRTARVIFRPTVSLFVEGLATRTFTVTLSDGLSTARSTVTVVIALNRAPEIVSIGGRSVDGAEVVGVEVSPNLLTAIFAATGIDDDYDNYPVEGLGPLQWKIDGGDSGKSTVTFLTADGQGGGSTAIDSLVVMIRLQRASTSTTVNFLLLLADGGGSDEAMVEVEVVVGKSTPKIITPAGFQPTTVATTAEYRFEVSDPGLGKNNEGFGWRVSPENVDVSLFTDRVTATVVATLRNVLSTLRGSYVLQVFNWDGNSTKIEVSLRTVNVKPSIEPATVALVLPVDQSSTEIEFTAGDTVGLSTFTWTFVDGASPSGDSTVRFVVDSQEPSTEITGTSRVRVLFEGPGSTASSETDVVRSFIVQVDDGFEGVSTARVEIGYATVPPVIYYQGSADPVTLDLQAGESTIALTVRGGGGDGGLIWYFTDISESLSVSFLVGAATLTTVVGSRKVVVQNILSTLTLRGSYVLQVANSDGNSTKIEVSLRTVNVKPSIEPATVVLVLPVDQSSTEIEFTAGDTVGLSTFTWTFVDGASPSGDSTVRFVVDSQEPSTKITGTSRVRVLFEGPGSTASSETDVVRSFIVQVDDGFEGVSTARVEIGYATVPPVIYYQGSADPVTLDLQAGESTIVLTVRGGGGSDDFNWYFTDISESLSVSFLDDDGTSTTVVGSRKVVVQNILSTLRGSYVLQVANSDGNSTKIEVSLRTVNVKPSIEPATVVLVLPVDQSSTEIEFTVGDTVGLSTFTWTFVDGASPSGDSTVRFVVDSQEPSTEITGTSRVRVLFEGPGSTASSETDVVRSFIVQVDDGFEGVSTARVVIRYATVPPVIYYQGSADPVTLDLQAGESTIALTVRGGGGDGGLIWYFTDISESLSVSFLVGAATSTTVVGSREVVVQLDFPESSPTDVDFAFTVKVRAGDSGLMDLLSVVSAPDQPLFRIRMFLGGAVR